MDTNTASTGILQLVSFSLGQEVYAVDILNVREINRMVTVTATPNAPYHIEGVINLRGQVIPVINLRKKFGLEEKGMDVHSRIIVVDVGTTVGMIVDSVSEVLRLPPDTVEPPPGMTAAGGRSDCVKGVGKLQDRLLILLDLHKLLDDCSGERRSLYSENTNN